MSMPNDITNTITTEFASLKNSLMDREASQFPVTGPAD
jgi:hypothetical protein